MTAIGIDVGGTKVSAARVEESGDCVGLRSVPTPGTVPELLEAITGLAQQLGGPGAALPVGVAAAAFVDESRTLVRFAPNLPWRDLPLVAELRRRLGTRVVLENDGNAAAWGELRHGAGRGVGDLLAVTVGTGVGGGLVLDGRLRRGAFGTAGEVGHLRLVPGGRPCGCGARGCLEAYASGTALVRGAREAARRGGPEVQPLLEETGVPEGIDGPLVTRVAGAGDPFARGLLADLGRSLGEGIASLVAVLDPAVVVVGGGVTEGAGDLVLAPLRDALAEALPDPAVRPSPDVRAAVLGGRAGLVGAAELARFEVAGTEMARSVGQG